MTVQEYINSLILFYNEASKYPLVRIKDESNLGEESKTLSTNTMRKTVRMEFKSDIVTFNYNLGFIVHSCCYIFNKLAFKNIKLLESLLEDEYSELLFTLKLTKKYCIFVLYDIYGTRIKKVKIKFTSINMF